MTVSVIVPNYNHAPYLNQRIDSILAQTYQDFELILLDDCSTDGSRDIMEGYRNNPHVGHIVYNEVNSGSAFRQWDKGIEMAQGEWVWIAESDDYADPTFLEEMLAASGHDDGCVLVTSPPCYVFPDGKTWSRPTTNTPTCHRGTDYACRQLVTGNSLPNVSALLMKTEALRRIDFSPIASMRLCGDWRLYANLCNIGNVVESNKVLSYFRQHDDSTSSVAERKSLPLTEGITVLDYLCRTLGLKSHVYARPWGRTWAKLERKHHYDKAMIKTITQSMKHHPAIQFWHTIYRIKLSLR